jgi:DNA-binding transcriptional regulator YiaG
MHKEKFLAISKIMGLNAVEMAEVIGVSQCTVRNWRTRNHPEVPIWAEKILKFEFKERGLAWPEN